MFKKHHSINVTSFLARTVFKRGWAAAFLPVFLAACGGGGGGGNYTAPSLEAPTAIPFPPADYSAVDAAFQEFLDNHEVLDGISYTLVDKEGTTHQAVFGDHTEDLVTILASTSKVPAVMAILALDDDPSVDFSISEPVREYLPFGSIYVDRTVEQMISNVTKMDFGFFRTKF